MTKVEAPPGAGREWWQGRLDHDFPRGVLATWDDGVLRSSPDGVYQVPRIEVIRMLGASPLVYLPVPGWEKVVSGPMTSYEVVQDSPLLAKAKIGNGVMTLSGAVSDETASLMEPFRRKWIEQEAERGGSSFE